MSSLMRVNGGGMPSASSRSYEQQRLVESSKFYETIKGNLAGSAGICDTSKYQRWIEKNGIRWLQMSPNPADVSEFFQDLNFWNKAPEARIAKLAGVWSRTFPRQEALYQFLMQSVGFLSVNIILEPFKAWIQTNPNPKEVSTFLYHIIQMEELGVKVDDLDVILRELNYFEQSVKNSICSVLHSIVWKSTQEKMQNCVRNWIAKANPSQDQISQVFRFAVKRNAPDNILQDFCRALAGKHLPSNDIRFYLNLARERDFPDDLIALLEEAWMNSNPSSEDVLTFLKSDLSTGSDKSELRKSIECKMGRFLMTRDLTPEHRLEFLQLTLGNSSFESLRIPAFKFWEALKPDKSQLDTFIDGFITGRDVSRGLKVEVHKAYLRTYSVLDLDDLMSSLVSKRIDPDLELIEVWIDVTRPSAQTVSDLLLKAVNVNCDQAIINELGLHLIGMQEISSSLLKKWGFSRVRNLPEFLERGFVKAWIAKGPSLQEKFAMWCHIIGSNFNEKILDVVEGSLRKEEDLPAKLSTLLFNSSSKDCPDLYQAIQQRETVGRLMFLTEMWLKKKVEFQAIFSFWMYALINKAPIRFLESLEQVITLQRPEAVKLVRKIVKLLN